MCAFTSDFDRSRSGYSPDRLDAMVWAFSELMLKVQPAISYVGTWNDIFGGAPAKKSAFPDDPNDPLGRIYNFSDVKRKFKTWR